MNPLCCPLPLCIHGNSCILRSTTGNRQCSNRLGSGHHLCVKHTSISLVCWPIRVRIQFGLYPVCTGVKILKRGRHPAWLLLAESQYSVWCWYSCQQLYVLWQFLTTAFFIFWTILILHSSTMWRMSWTRHVFKGYPSSSWPVFQHARHVTMCHRNTSWRNYLSKDCKENMSRHHDMSRHYHNMSSILWHVFLTSDVARHGTCHDKLVTLSWHGDMSMTLRWHSPHRDSQILMKACKRPDLQWQWGILLVTNDPPWNILMA
jgi:hypothetical protein